MFDEVIVAVDDDEAALDALALGKTLASPVAALIAAARGRLAALGDVEPHAEYGGRSRELARFGASVDLLVIGPRDQERESALHLVPLALRLAQHAPCPVLVVAKPVPVASDDR